MLSASTVPRATPPAHLVERNALRLTIQYLENGVLRLASLGVASLVDVYPEKFLPEREPIASPLPADVRDLAWLALEELGLASTVTRVSVCDGFCRAIGDDLVELTLWRSE